MSKIISNENRIDEVRKLIYSAISHCGGSWIEVSDTYARQICQLFEAELEEALAQKDREWIKEIESMTPPSSQADFLLVKRVSSPQAIKELTEKIYKRFLEKLRGDEEIPAPLIDEIEKLRDNSELTSSEAISRAYENWEGSHAKN